MKILISSQVSFRRPLSTSIPHRMPRQREEHVLEIRRYGLEISHLDSVFGDALYDVADEVLATPSKHDPRVLTFDRVGGSDRAEPCLRLAARRALVGSHVSAS